MLPFPSDAPVLPIVIFALDDSPALQPSREEPPALRHWHVEACLHQTGKADHTHRTYRGQLVRFATWCPKS